MSNEAPTQPSNSAKAPTATELYRIAAFTAALLFTWTAWAAYGAATLVIALLVVVSVGSLAQKTNLAPIVFLIAFLLLELWGEQPRSTPTRFVIVGSLLGVVIFNARALAATEPIRRQATPPRRLWRMLTPPLRRLLRQDLPVPMLPARELERNHSVAFDRRLGPEARPPRIGRKQFIDGEWCRSQVQPPVLAPPRRRGIRSINA